MHKSMKIAVLALVGVLAAATPVEPASAKPTESPSTHPSGLRIIGPAPIDPVPDGVADIYGLAFRLAEENPRDFGYPQITDGRVILAGTSDKTGGFAGVVDSVQRASAILAFLESTKSSDTDGIPTDKKLPAEPDLADALTRGISFIDGSSSFADVRKLQDDVFDFAIIDKFADAGAWQTEVDVDGEVILTVEELTGELANAVVSQFGAESLQVRIEKHPGALPQPRNGDTSPFKGGSMLELPSSDPDVDYTGRCSSAFAWKYGADWRMLTAGHCAWPGAWPVDAPVAYMGWVTATSRENWTAGIGTVAFSGSTTPRGDLALIEMSSPRTASPRMYTGPVNSSTWRWVSAMWSRRAQSGDQYCVGGTRGGELCGWVVSATVANHRYSNGETVRPAVISRGKTGACTRPGDSGGPVYTVPSNGTVWAKGVHSGGFMGGSDYIGGTLDPCTEVFTDIWDAYYAFPGSLAVS